jgi:tetratricopeptide (TPR) repeat protein
VKETREPLKRAIAISLALLVVLGGVIAVQENTASVAESNSARETTRVAVRAMRASVALDLASGAHTGSGSEREFLGSRPPLTSAAPAELRAARAGLPPGPARAELDRLRFTAEHEKLRQHSLATTRIRWNDVATRYTTAIALLAAGLFFVGFALTVEGPPRRVSYVLGVVVAAFAAGWTVYIHQLSIPGTPERALAAAARGAVLIEHGDYARAVSSYDAAIAVDGDFAAAYAGRSRARLLTANPDLESTQAFTDRSGHASAAAAQDAEHALALEGRRDVAGLELVALSAFYRGRYEAATEAAAEASRINPRVPDLWLLRSAAEAAIGEGGAADAALLRAIAVLDGGESAQRLRLLGAGYLSYLASVEMRVPSRAAEARRLANRFVAYETALALRRSLKGSLPAEGRVAVDRLRYRDGRLMLRLRWRELPPGTALSAIGYERALAGAAWTQPPRLALFVHVSGSGERALSVPLDPVCKPTGVRADVYLNGLPAGTRTGPGVAATCGG